MKSLSPPHVRVPGGSTVTTSRPVAIWIFIGVIMLLIQVILGGVTRLTGSGLSITEWNVVTGTLPPLNTAQWQSAFDKYQQTPQYRLLNFDFTLQDFKFIFFWEWFHRFWARMVGVVFVVGFVWLLWKRNLKPEMARPLIILFLLGALQGAIGWIMVASGLIGDAIYVAPTRLALHFVFALGLIVYAFWVGLRLWVPGPGRIALEKKEEAANSWQQPSQQLILQQRLMQRWTVVILVVLFMQLLFGALMAGHKAAIAAPTWPTINGSWVPDHLFSSGSVLKDLVGNRITVQFVHRGLAYLILLLVLGWTWQSSQATGMPNSFRRLSWLPAGVVCLQILLGISSLLTAKGIVPRQWGSFDWLAEFHQITGLLFLLTMVGMLYLVRTVRHSVTV